MTEVEAADYLGVSTNFIAALLDQGKLPYALQDGARDIRLEVLNDYKAARHKRAQAALQGLTDQAQDLDLGY